jgi:hypothetical protein
MARYLASRPRETSGFGSYRILRVKAQKADSTFTMRSTMTPSPHATFCRRDGICRRAGKTRPASFQGLAGSAGRLNGRIGCQTSQPARPADSLMNLAGRETIGSLHVARAICATLRLTSTSRIGRLLPIDLKKQSVDWPLHWRQQKAPGRLCRGP